MKYLLLAGMLLATLGVDSAHINAYVTPYYNSDGPSIHVGKFSGGLASKDDRRFIATILQMKRQWRQLNFAELYVGAIQLYDRGYRNEATYWFYTAQYQGRLFGQLVDQRKMGSMGSPGFELVHAFEAFVQLVGPDINGYAFGNLGELTSIIHQVQRDQQNVVDLGAIYPRVAFAPKSQWQSTNATTNTGMDQLTDFIMKNSGQIESKRNANGSAARFGRLTSKRFPGGF